MKTKVIYTLKMARYLLEHGCYCVKVRPNPNVPWLNIYEFYDTPFLQEKMTQFTKEEKGHGSK